LCIVLLALLPAAASAQSGGETLTISLRRTFGYAAGSRVQGRFTLSASGPDDLARVTFTMDGNPLAEVTEPPFQVAFSTGDYALGVHTLSAYGTTATGQTLEAQPIQREFVSAEASTEAAFKIVGPIVIGALLLVLVGSVVPALSRKKKPFELGAYGIAGGAVCPRCGMPYSRSAMGPNLVIGKLERCPHCGKWAIVPRASQAKLQAAEARYEHDAHQGEVDPDQHARRYERMLDDSRFEE